MRTSALFTDRTRRRLVGSLRQLADRRPPRHAARRRFEVLLNERVALVRSDLLEIAARVAGYNGEHGPLKPPDIRQAMKSIWEIYSEFYMWVDPEEPGDDDDDDEEEP